MYLGKKQNQKPKRTLGQKVGSAVYGLGSKIAQGVLTQVIMKNLPKLLL